MTRPRMQGLLRRGGELVADSAPRRAILAALPYAIPRRFDPACAGDLDAAFELRVDEHSFGVRIASGRCSVTPGPAPDAGAFVSVSGEDLVRLASGSASWPRLLSSGRLELAGDPFLALRFPLLFGLRASIPGRERERR